MDFNILANSIWMQIVMVWRAPVPFLALAIAIWFLVRWHFSGAYQTRLANAESTKELLERQLQEYRDKLSGASPDEAKARLDALESRIDALGPRRLSSEQRNLISAALDKFAGSYVVITQDMAVADARSLSQDIAAAFNAARWKVSTSMVMGLGNPPLSGVAVRVGNPESLSAPQEAIIFALKEAGLEFDIQNGRQTSSRLDEPESEVEIIVTNRQDL
jgi:hypothetical protein